MKRLILSFALVLFAASAFAQMGGGHDVLVTPDGTVYTVDSAFPSATSTIAASTILELGIQNGSSASQVIIPGSTVYGYHFGGTLAYDADSKTLFVLWIHMPNGMLSELLLSSYRDGVWQPTVSIDPQPNHMSSNLRLGLTRRVSQLQQDGSYADVPALILHALWWDDSGRAEGAQYAMLPVENGAVSPAAIEIHSLEDFVSSGDEIPNNVSATFNSEILRHPAIVSSAMQSTVDVIFGDTANKSIHEVTLHPIADTRVHIPVGIGGGGSGGGKPMSLSAPPNFSANWQGPVTVISRGGRLVFANTGDTSVSYITYSGGTWTDVKSIGTDSKFSAEAALAAIDKMLSTQ